MTDPSPGITIDLGEAMMVAQQDPIFLLRGHAVGAYAMLEQALCTLFSHVSGTDQSVAGTIFFKITSADARNSILEKLIRKKFGSSSNLFWNSYFRGIRFIDNQRNQIVHWTVVNEIGGPPPGGIRVILQPGNFWDNIGPDRIAITSGDLATFIRRCDVYSRLCNMFIVTKVVHPASDTPTWQEIFRRPFAYPPPDTHPISPSYKAPDSPPPPLQESGPPPPSQA